MGQKTTASHNEVVLMAGSLGLSTLVCLLNNGNDGQTETQANLLGPFWRDDPPPSASGDTLVRSPTPGAGADRSRPIEDQRRARRSPAPRSTSGTPRRRASTKTRIPRRPR